MGRPFARELPRAFVSSGVYVSDSGSSQIDWNDEADLAPTERTDFVFVGGDSGRPTTEMQALMESPPFTEPEVSRLERLELRDVICDALDDLDEQEQWIFDALFVRRLSLRELAAEIAMPKTTVAR